jgi:diguanylate cyclase (GGDEF)-like protein/PAS domain S-box-containing protein
MGQWVMTERIEIQAEIRAELQAEILEAALGAVEEGIAVLDCESRVLLWNPAAAAISGYRGSELLSRGLPGNFYEIDVHPARPGQAFETLDSVEPFEPAARVADRAIAVHLRHALGHVLPAMLRHTPLRDAVGKRFGTLLRFHPVEEVDTLPHGEMNEDGSLQKHVESSQADMEDRLDEAWQEWTCNGVPFGLLWITVDQSATLRRTHGHDGSEAMLAIVERTLLHALRPTEILGRWGTHEFLVLCHERTREMLEAHARHVCQLARTADFRWWGDRVNLTVSIGAAQAPDGERQDEKLGGLLKRAQKAMQTAIYGGGNAVVALEVKTENGGQSCSQS